MKRESGQTGVMMALSLTVLFGLVGFTVDVGSSYYTKQKAQAAAESGAMAAASYAKANGITCGTNGITCNSTLTSCSSITTGVLYVGCQYASQNGFPMSAISMAANTNTPPCNPCTSPGYWIEARVATSRNNLFEEVTGPASANINAQAFAGVNGSTGSGTGTGTTSTVPATCLWVLDPTDKQTFLVSGASVALSGCTAQINSTATDPVNKQPSNSAANANGSSTLTGTYDVVGAGDYNQNYCQTGGPFVCGAASVADPLIGLRAVNETTDIGTTSCTHTTQYNPPNGATTIPSGIYCGGINIGNSNATVTFQTGGVFEIRDGSLSISSGTVRGANVMFYFTTATPTTTADPVVNINTSNVTLSAPASGTFKGILFYGNRAAQVAASGTNNVIQAGSNPNITGTFYFPTGNVLYSGQAATNGGHVSIISYRLQVNGGSAFTWDSTGTYTGLATYWASGGTTTTYTSNLIE
jgi:Flp pilus assembly protein TadG